METHPPGLPGWHRGAQVRGETPNRWAFPPGCCCRTEPVSCGKALCPDRGGPGQSDTERGPSWSPWDTLPGSLCPDDRYFPWIGTSGSWYHMHHRLLSFTDLTRRFREETRLKTHRCPWEGVHRGEQSCRNRKRVHLPSRSHQAPWLATPCAGAAPVSTPRPRGANYYFTAPAASLKPDDYHSLPKRDLGTNTFHPTNATIKMQLRGGDRQERVPSLLGEVAQIAVTNTKGFINRQKLIVCRLN